MGYDGEQEDGSGGRGEEGRVEVEESIVHFHWSLCNTHHWEVNRKFAYGWLEVCGRDISFSLSFIHY